MIADLDGTPIIAYQTPGKTSFDLRTSLLAIQQDVQVIQNTFKNSFAIFQKYNGSLNGLTNCYVAKRQMTLLETPLCFFFRPKLFNTLLYLLLLDLVLLAMVWSVFFSIKYSGNISV